MVSFLFGKNLQRLRIYIFSRVFLLFYSKLGSTQIFNHIFLYLLHSCNVGDFIPEKNSQKQSRNSSHNHDRKDLAGEHPQGDLIQLLLALIFIIVWCIDTFWLHWTIWLNTYIYISLRLVFGFIILGIALYIANQTMHTVFGEIRDPPQVISEKLYKYFRHPMYLASILFYIALIIFSWSVAAIGIFILAVLFYNYIARYEEQLLLKVFGEAYQKYMDHVPRWGL